LLPEDFSLTERSCFSKNKSFRNVFMFELDKNRAEKHFDSFDRRILSIQKQILGRDEARLQKQ